MQQLAWLLATCPDTKRRDPAKAVDLGAGVVKIQPENGDAWQTLGVAQYRTGNWQTAIESLNKSVRLQNDGEASDFFFLAMAHYHLGDTVRAQQRYDQGVKWMKNKKPSDSELQRFRNEAAALLGIEKQSPDKEDASKTESSEPSSKGSNDANGHP